MCVLAYLIFETPAVTVAGDILWSW